VNSTKGIIDQGYYIEASVITHSDCDQIARAVDAISPNIKRAGVRNLMSYPAFREIANESRLLELASELHGSPMVPFKATLFSKTGKANWLVAWHQDTALPLERFEKRDGWGALSRKAGVVYAQAPAPTLARILALRIHLDPSTENNGPLRVLSGSHRFGILNSEQIGAIACETDSVDCLVGKGGVIAMSPLLLHASSKSISDEPRRVLHIEYAETRNLEPGIRLAIA